MTRRLLAVAIIFGLGLGCGVRASRAEDPYIVLASTTSVDNSGLLTHILPVFKKASGIDVHVVALGTGQALDVARRGDADLVLVHDPDAEKKFLDEGHGINRREIAWNDFIIVGPATDPAKIKGTKDVLAAFHAIWTSDAAFVSRGDKSGTDALEKRLWKAADLDPTKAGGWYKDIGGGMGAALNAAAAMDAYTLSDRGTWLSFSNKAHLAIVLEGDSRLLNRYDVIELDPKLHAKAKLDLAKKFADWLVSADGQSAIGGYEMAGQKLFHPEADPKPVSTGS
jgi:tungstate transport system substrate-binding protein